MFFIAMVVDVREDSVKKIVSHVGDVVSGIVIEIAGVSVRRLMKNW